MLCCFKSDSRYNYFLSFSQALAFFFCFGLILACFFYMILPVCISGKTDDVLYELKGLSITHGIFNFRTSVKAFFILGIVAILGWLGMTYDGASSCPSDRPLRDYEIRTCYPCDTNEKITLNPLLSVSLKDQCRVCSNREIDRYLGFSCVIKCPQNRPIRDFEGVCRACDVARPIYIGYSYEDQCVMCQAREFSHGFCFLKCPKEKPFRDFEGRCLTKGEI